MRAGSPPLLSPAPGPGGSARAPEQSAAPVQPLQRGQGMRPGALFYRRIASPLHATRAGVGALWVLALMAATLLIYHPLALLALLGAVLLAGVGAGVGRQLARAMRGAAIVWLPIVIVNVLVSRDGLTVFARLGDLGPFGQGDLTVEAVVYGAVIALKVMLLVLITTLASLAVDPDDTLRILRRLSFRSALTASLATRMIPVLAADAERLAEAQRTRPDGGPRGARGRLALLCAVVAGSLDRAMDVAATLEVRGFATARRAPRAAPARVAPRPRASRSAPSPSSRLRSLGRLAGARASTRTPKCTPPSAPARSRSVWRSSPRCCCRSPTAGGSSHERAAALRPCRPTPIPAPRPTRCDDVHLDVRPGEFCLLAGLSGDGKSTLLRAACGLVPHFHGGRFAGRVTLAGLDTREHGPARSRCARRGAVPGSRDAARDEHGAGGARARAREPRPRLGRRRARRRGGRARARHRPTARALHARALGR